MFDETEQRQLTDRMTNIVMALPIRPQLKMAMAVELLTILAHMMVADKPEHAHITEWREGDTVFSIPMRLMQSMDERAREKGIGEFPKKEHEGIKGVAIEIHEHQGGRRETNSER